MSNLGRNDPCPCGSGKKFKRCCLGRPPSVHTIPPEYIQRIEESRRRERQRRELYGHVRPIIHAEAKGRRFVAAGNRVFLSKAWTTFHDFLFSYIIDTLGGEWFEAEEEKPEADWHPVITWKKGWERFRVGHKAGPDGACRAIPDGKSQAYLSLAYDL